MNKIVTCNFQQQQKKQGTKFVRDPIICIQSWYNFKKPLDKYYKAEVSAKSLLYAFFDHLILFLELHFRASGCGGLPSLLSGSVQAIILCLMLQTVKGCIL